MVIRIFRFIESEIIFEVEIFRKRSGDTLYYGSCPKCGKNFDYDEGDVGRTVRCRHCNTPMKLVRRGEERERDRGGGGSTNPRGELA